MKTTELCKSFTTLNSVTIFKIRISITKNRWNNQCNVYKSKHLIGDTLQFQKFSTEGSCSQLFLSYSNDQHFSVFICNTVTVIQTLLTLTFISFFKSVLCCIRIYNIPNFNGGILALRRSLRFYCSKNIIK